MPTPAGVPVRIIVPGGSSVPCERKLTRVGISKIRSLFEMSEISSEEEETRKI
jgi:hypothetical protein